MIITNISWCDANGDTLESDGLPNTIEIPSVILTNVSLSDIGVSDWVWKYLFDRFGAVSDGYNFTLVL